eukprot:sb/3476261/
MAAEQRTQAAWTDPMEPHRGWAMVRHNSVVYRDASEIWRSNTIHTINHIRKRMMDIFKKYPDLYEEMIEEKKDAEMLSLYKSMQPTVSGNLVTKLPLPCRRAKCTKQKLSLGYVIDAV